LPYVDKEHLQRARELRSAATPAERQLWRLLHDPRLDNWHFRRQHPIPPYFADFACLPARLVIEADGGQHAPNAHDEQRDMFLRERGWRVLRFWNEEVIKSPDYVVETILRALAPTPTRPHFVGEGE
jgi:primosomal protein N' (replication factor Y)